MLIVLKKNHLDVDNNYLNTSYPHIINNR